jgi:hypothetical protein
MIDAQVSDVRSLTRKAGVKPTITRFNGNSHPVLLEIAPGERSFSGPIVMDVPEQPQRNNAPRRRPAGDGRSGGGGGQRGNRSRGGQRSYSTTSTSSSGRSGGSRAR